MAVLLNNTPQFEIARTTLTAEWKQEAAFAYCEDSLPVTCRFQDIVGVAQMLIDFVKDNDQIHSSNGKYDLQSFDKGIRSCTRILEALSPDTQSRQKA